MQDLTVEEPHASKEPAEGQNSARPMQGWIRMTEDRTAPSGERKSWLERVLGVFGDVRPGEGLTVVLLFANIFLILFAYYVLKTVREGLIVSGSMFGLGGDELKIYTGAAMAFLLLAVVPAYGAVASRVDRARLINLSLGFVMASLVVFFALGRLGLDLAIPFYLWLGIVNVFLIAQFWSYANDIYTEGQGKRLFAIIAVGGSLGAIFGPKMAAILKDYTFTLMLGAAVVFGICALLYNLVNHRQRTVHPRQGDTGREPLSREGGFRLVLSSRYLLLIALMILATNLVNTTGEFILSNGAREYAQEVVPDDSFAEIADADEREDAIEAGRTAAISGFYGNFFSVVNLLALLIQSLLVSRIFKYLGVRVALFALPVIAFGGYLAIGLVGGLLILRVAKTAENATDYSLQNTVRQALFLPTSRDAKYKAKAAIDTFFVRMGDALSAAVVAVGVHLLAFGRAEFAFLNVGLALLWIVLSVGIAREHRKISAAESHG